MKKRDLMKEIRTIAYEYQTDILKANTNLNENTQSYIFNKLIDIVCEVQTSTKIKTKEKIEKLLNLIKSILENNKIRPLIDLKNKLNGVKIYL